MGGEEGWFLTKEPLGKVSSTPLSYLNTLLLRNVKVSGPYMEVNKQKYLGNKEVRSVSWVWILCSVVLPSLSMAVFSEHVSPNLWALFNSGVCFTESVVLKTVQINKIPTLTKTPSFGEQL